MRAIKSQFVAVIGFSLFGTFASAATYQAPYAPIPRDSNVVSLVSAMSMAAYGLLGKFPDPRADLLSDCQTESIRVRGAVGAFSNTHLPWYGRMALPFMECNPLAIANVVMGRFPVLASYWTVHVQGEYTGNFASDFVVKQLISPRSPVVIPLYGNWDHWATIYQVNAEQLFPGEPFTISGVLLKDGLPVGYGDSLGDKSLPDPMEDMDGWAFHNKYYMALSHYRGEPCSLDSRNPCNKTPYFDVWYKQYVAIFDQVPAARRTGLDPETITVSYVRPPGLTAAGKMSASIASQRVFDTLRLTGRDRRPEVHNLMLNGHADTAYRVLGRWPGGTRNDYYLVPLRSAQNMLLAFVMLDAEDGAFLQLTLLGEPMAYAPLSAEQAQNQAQTVVRPGERLGAGVLTWEPTYAEQVVATPYLPYYEFPVVDRDGKSSEVVRVNFRSGVVLGRGAVTP